MGTTTSAQDISSYREAREGEEWSSSANERITWRSLPGTIVDHSGPVEFERLPGARRTIVRAQMDYGNMVHALGASAASLLGATQFPRSRPYVGH